MKRSILLLAVLSFLSFFSCTKVVFTEPQPTDTDNLSQFPKRLIGTYKNMEDGSMVVINKTTMVLIYDFDDRTNRNDLDSTLRLEGDSLLDLTTGKKAFVRFEGDTVIRHQHFVDSTFSIDYDNVLRKYKGYYFVNNRVDRMGWWVRKLTLKKGVLAIASIESREDIALLQEVAEMPQDTSLPMSFTPTKKQFREYVTAQGFKDEEVYVRIR
jgi:hypothetical protein